MATKIRLQRHGRKGKPYYKIVIADARAKRDGKFIERIGSYDPTSVPATIELDVNTALHWVLKGAQPTDTVKAILKFKGVMYKKHLLRGVEKGSLTEEQAEEKFQAWLGDKEAKIVDRQDAQSKKVKAKIEASVQAGKEKAEAKLKAMNEPVVEEVEAPAETPEATSEEVETPAAEATEEVVAEETTETVEEAKDATEVIGDAKAEAEVTAEEAKEVVAEAEEKAEEKTEDTEEEKA